MLAMQQLEQGEILERVQLPVITTASLNQKHLSVMMHLLDQIRHLLLLLLLAPALLLVQVV